MASLPSFARTQPLGFTDFLREIRDQIYAECLVSGGVVALSNLKSSAQAKSVLYEHNLFFSDLVAPWAYERSPQWLQCFQLHERDLLHCLSCERQG